MMNHLMKKHQHMAVFRYIGGEEESEFVVNAGGRFLQIATRQHGSALQNFSEKCLGAMVFKPVPAGIKFRELKDSEKEKLNTHFNLMSYMPGTKVKALEDTTIKISMELYGQHTHPQWMTDILDSLHTNLETEIGDDPIIELEAAATPKTSTPKPSTKKTKDSRIILGVKKRAAPAGESNKSSKAARRAPSPVLNSPPSSPISSPSPSSSATYQYPLTREAGVQCELGDPPVRIEATVGLKTMMLSFVEKRN